MDIAIWIAGVLLIIGFGGSGMAKVTGQAAMRQAADHFNIPWERFRLLGFAELAAAAAIIIGLVWDRFTWLAIAAAVGLALVGIGGAIFHMRAGDKPKDYAPALLLGLIAVAFAIVAGARL